jgi:hypothetical protein
MTVQTPPIEETGNNRSNLSTAMAEREMSPDVDR